MRSLITLDALSAQDISSLVARAASAAYRGDELSGKAVALMFFEPSTRTRLSFELAARRLGADVLVFHTETSSASKGESLQDTVQTVSAIGADILVVRHSSEGVPEQVQEWTGKPVVNAGDGSRAHPTQALLDAVTLTRHFGSVDGLRMGIVGDVAHSRVAASLLRAMPALGVDVVLIGPDDLLPPQSRAAKTSDLDRILPALDVVYLLRVQTERGAVPGGDYQEHFQMSNERVAAMKAGAVVMHPGPINRGVEIAGDVADGPRSMILAQVANGVPTRMAVLDAVGKDDG